MPKIQIHESFRSPVATNTPNQASTYARQQFEAGLQWLQSQGVEVERHVIGTKNSFSATDDAVQTAIDLQGEEVLPVTTFDGTIIGIGGYWSQCVRNML